MMPDALHLDEVLEISMRLATAAALGGLIGIERQFAHKAAGLRTHMTVSLASAVFVVIAIQSGAQIADVSRILQGIAAGVGFLGAGTILKGTSEETIQGLTTAATIWLTAAIGAAAGAGHAVVASISVAVAWVILLVFKLVETTLRRR